MESSGGYSDLLPSLLHPDDCKSCKAVQAIHSFIRGFTGSHSLILRLTGPLSILFYSLDYSIYMSHYKNHNGQVKWDEKTQMGQYGIACNSAHSPLSHIERSYFNFRYLPFSRTIQTLQAGVHIYVLNQFPVFQSQSLFPRSPSMLWTFWSWCLG